MSEKVFLQKTAMIIAGFGDAVAHHVLPLDQAIDLIKAYVRRSFPVNDERRVERLSVYLADEMARRAFDTWESDQQSVDPPPLVAALEAGITEAAMDLLQGALRSWLQVIVRPAADTLSWSYPDERVLFRCRLIQDAGGWTCELDDIGGNFVQLLEQSATGMAISHPSKSFLFRSTAERHGIQSDRNGVLFTRHQITPTAPQSIIAIAPRLCEDAWKMVRIRDACVQSLLGVGAIKHAEIALENMKPPADELTIPFPS